MVLRNNKNTASTTWKKWDLSWNYWSLLCLTRCSGKEYWILVGCGDDILMKLILGVDPTGRIGVEIIHAWNSTINNPVSYSFLIKQQILRQNKNTGFEMEGRI